MNDPRATSAALPQRSARANDSDAPPPDPAELRPRTATTCRSPQSASRKTPTPWWMRSRRNNTPPSPPTRPARQAVSRAGRPLCRHQRRRGHARQAGQRRLQSDFEEVGTRASDLGRQTSGPSTCQGSAQQLPYRSGPKALLHPKTVSLRSRGSRSDVRGLTPEV